MATIDQAVARRERTQLSASGAPPAVKVAYIMSRFPKLSETFVLYEMLALQQQGVDVEVFPLINERAKVVHAEAKPFVERAHYLPVLSLPILKANLHFLRTKPAAYLGVWRDVLRGTFGSLNYMLGGLGIIPKAAKFAYDMQRLGVRHVHAHFANHPTVAALVINRLTGIPYSFTAHAHAGSSRTWSGIVSRARLVRAEERGLSTYEVTIVPRLWLLVRLKMQPMILAGKPSRL